MTDRYCPVQGKNCYDKRGAETARNKRWREDHVRLRIYQCDDCGAWHLTHMVPPSEYHRKPKGIYWRHKHRDQ